MEQGDNVGHSRIISGRDAAGRPVPAEEPVLEVDLGLADEVVRAEEVPVEDADGEDGVLREGGLELEELAEDGVELLGDVVLLVGDALGAELEDEVGVGLAVDVHRVEVVGLDDVDPHEDVQGVVGGEALSNQRPIALVSDPFVHRTDCQRHQWHIRCITWKNPYCGSNPMTVWSSRSLGSGSL